jgi:hypothetical protein
MRALSEHVTPIGRLTKDSVTFKLLVAELAAMPNDKSKCMYVCMYVFALSSRQAYFEFITPPSMCMYVCVCVCVCTE